MLLSHACRVIMMPIKTTKVRSTLMRAQNVTGYLQLQSCGGSGIVRGFKTSAPLYDNKRGFFRRVKALFSLQLRNLAVNITPTIPVWEKLSKFGKTLAKLGVAALGLGTFAYCGMFLFMSLDLNKSGRSTRRPAHVEERIHSTCAHFAESFVVEVFTIAVALRSPTVMNLMRNSRRNVTAALALSVTTGFLAWNIPYQPGFGTKQMCWLGHCVAFGIAAAGFWARLSGGASFRHYLPVILKTAVCTVGVLGVLYTVAIVYAQNDTFSLLFGGSHMGVLISLFHDSLFTHRVTTYPSFTVAWSTFLLVYLSGWLLYNAHTVAKYAEALPPDQVYDPINMSMSIYFNGLSRGALEIMSGGGNAIRRK